ncbi:His-Xaa-Ser system radical SAM maturase HxsC [Stakelama sediminis]|uniref:His-Xaa-Ser system radical SAM maturase HxsC n=1 Tax=Stakelama sediminis TaxID=463200 RepID=A0A840Z2G1_9SPHN|nr:His-Xaa-Ser system radical SAM maturase HxsC [Stakelama sediminis]
MLVEAEGNSATYASKAGLFTIDGVAASGLAGDVLLIQPREQRAERLIRATSPHNTLLVTERCDQLCVMCSQPPKKTHVDRFALFEEACMLAPENMLIGITGGEPTLYRHQLFDLIERIYRTRPDLSFHVLTNAQHFENDDIDRMLGPAYARVSWGIPLYASQSALHDEIVGKRGAFSQLLENFAILMRAGARIELRTVLLRGNYPALPELAHFVASRLRCIEAWSIMQLEHSGFARRRWASLAVNPRLDFAPLREAMDWSFLHQMPVQLFNIPRCALPEDYRRFAVASISDWKQKFLSACDGCRERDLCCGFFEWHPDQDECAKVTPL